MHLHNHSAYSPLDGLGLPEQIVARTLELGHDAISITDHGTVSGWTPFFLACKQGGIKPIFGVEAYIVEDRLVKNRKKQNEDTGVQGIPHITVVAATKEGFRNLRYLVEESYRSGMFAGKPRIDVDLLIKYQKGLFVTSGCPTAFPTRLIAADRKQDAFNFVKKLSDNIENFAIEVVAQPGYAPAEKAAPFLFDFAEILGRKVVLTGDNHFPRKSDHEAQTMLLRISVKKQIDQPIWSGMENGLPSYQYICSEQELLDRAETMYPGLAYREAIDNARNFCEDFEYIELPKGSFPKVGAGINATAELERLAIEGIRKRFSDGYVRDTSLENKKRYAARLKYELGVIIKKGVADYFVILANLVTEQKRTGSFVICRGSAGGCLVAYAMGISETDPILHGLYFERFYDEHRPDAPDIDIDSSPSTRDKMFNRLGEKFYVGKLEAQNELTLKAALIDVARTCYISRDKIESAIGAIDESTSVEPVEVTELIKKYPDLAVARKLVGQIRGYGRHAAAVIISNDEIEIPVVDKIDSKTKSVVRTVTMDKKGAEKTGFLKADLLSVAGIEVIERTLRRISMTADDMYKLGLDDPNVVKEIREYPAGIFQFDGSVHGIFNQISGNNFDDMVAASALCRPGAFAFVGKYATRRKDFSGLVGEILNSTYGVCLYQEQVMGIARAASFDWPAVHSLRKAISASSTAKKESVDAVSAAMKSLREGLEKIGEFDPDLIENVRAHGKYSFNKSHCTTYAIIGYVMAWLKFYYPAEFCEEYINMEIASEGTNWILVRRLIFDLQRKGVIQKTVVIDSRENSKPIRIENGTIYGSFLAIHGCGQKKGQLIATSLSLHAKGLLKDLTDGTAKVVSTVYEASRNGDKDFDVLLHWFPWIPMGSTKHYRGIVETIQQQTGYDGTEELARYSDRAYSPRTIKRAKEITVAGYVTAKVRKQKTLAMPYAIIRLLLENPGGQIEVEISARDRNLYEYTLKNIERGFFYAFMGSFNGKVLKAGSAIEINARNFSAKSEVEDIEEVGDENE